MTTQIPDSCTFDGRKWEIVDWEGDSDCVPSNESLGIVTRSPGTNNWSGRIDHFLVHREQLFLFKVEVCLDPSNKGILPFGARREVIRRYPVYEHHNGQGMSLVQHVVELDRLVFDDLRIGFTGRLFLTYPYADDWDMLWPIDETDFDAIREAVLTFDDGSLVDIEERDIEQD
jgi:hypothetical protein